MKALVCVLVTLAVAAPVAADTYVTGNIVTDTTWNPAGSPYIIQGTILIDASSTLTIEPGVVVRFEDQTGLRGMEASSIIAIGTSGSPILFTSDLGTPAPGDWQYVGVKHSLGSEFSHCTFEYGTYGLNLYHSDSPVSHCTMRYNSTTGITCDQSAPIITHSSIIDNSRGMKIFGPDVGPVINNCNLCNTSYENLMITGYEELPIVIIDAENNWWGTDDEEEIGWTINIHSSAEGFVEVDFDPWLHGTGLEEGTTWSRVKSLFAN